MSQSQMVTLDDKEVSRRVALKATHDKVFERKLLACASPDFVGYLGKESAENYTSVSHAISAIRIDIVDQAGLNAPLLNGHPQDLTPYLKTTKNSKLTLGKETVQKVDGVKVNTMERDREWGWVVSHQSCVQQPAISYLI